MAWIKKGTSVTSAFQQQAVRIQSAVVVYSVSLGFTTKTRSKAQAVTQHTWTEEIP
jgi:hypothetical protein